MPCRLQASGWGWPPSRPPSIAPSSSSRASANLPSPHSGVLIAGMSTGNRWPWPVARATANPRRAWATACS
jgi:hypothetical protein